jgi:hypothetical protein
VIGALAVWCAAVLWLLWRVVVAVEAEPEEWAGIAGFTPLPEEEEEGSGADVRAR